MRTLLEMSSFLVIEFCLEQTKASIICKRRKWSERKVRNFRGVQSNWETFILRLRKRKKQYPWAFTQATSFASLRFISSGTTQYSAGKSRNRKPEKRCCLHFFLVSYFPVQAETERNNFENAINNKCFYLKLSLNLEALGVSLPYAGWFKL